MPSISTVYLVWPNFSKRCTYGEHVILNNHEFMMIGRLTANSKLVSAIQTEVEGCENVAHLRQPQDKKCIKTLIS